MTSLVGIPALAPDVLIRPGIEDEDDEPRSRLIGDEIRASYAVALTSVSRIVVSDLGGLEILIAGARFNPMLTCIINLIGPIGSAAIVPCYSGKSGQGYLPKPRSASQLAFVTPPLALGTYDLHVSQGGFGVVLANALDVVPHDYRTTVYAFRSLLPRRFRLGPRSLDNEPSAVIPAAPEMGAIADQVGNVGDPFSLAAPALDATPYVVRSWSIVGTLPAGLTVDAATGAISGTPTTGGTTTDLKLRAATALHNIDSETFDFVIGAPTSIIYDDPNTIYDDPLVTYEGF